MPLYVCLRQGTQGDHHLPGRMQENRYSDSRGGKKQKGAVAGEGLGRGEIIQVNDDVIGKNANL